VIKEAINRILELDRPQIVGVGGRDYATKQLHPILDPQPRALGLSTLSGLVAYCRRNPDGFDLDSGIFALVKSECEVVLQGGTYGLFHQRDTHATVLHSEPSAFKPNTFYALEDFLVILNTAFVLDETVQVLTKLFGNVRAEDVTSWNDDGITQAVMSRRGIALVESVPIPNLVPLRPYRTFRDIDQPESLFLVRAKQKDLSPPAVALFESGGEQWRFTAMDFIAEYLTKHLPEEITVIR